MKKKASQSGRKTRVIKKRVTNKGPHANMSFISLVTKHMQESVSTFINEEIKTQFGVVMDQLRTVLQSRIDLALGNINIRTQAIEEALFAAFPKKMSEALIDAKSIEIEDRLLSLIPITGAVQAGDNVRITLTTEDTPEPQRFSFPTVHTEPYQIESLEKSIVGMTVGEKKTVKFELYDMATEGIVQVIAASRKPFTESKEEVKKLLNED